MAVDNLCPQCRTPLNLETEGDFDTWVCPEGHGTGITLSEAHGHLQDDEIKAIWGAAKSGATSSLLSPALGTPMVSITIAVDDDEVEGNEGTNSRFVTLDVATEEQFLWFQVVDFENLPDDLPNPEPSPEEQARIDQIAGDWVEGNVAAAQERINVGYRFGSQEAAKLGLNGLMNRLGKTYQSRGDKAYDKNA